MAFPLKAICLLFASLLTAACGEGHKVDSTDEAAAEEVEAPVDSGLADIYGSIAFKASAQPSVGYILRLFDHTSLNVQQTLTDSSGTYKFPIRWFIPGNSYSIELLTSDFVRVGDFDFQPAVPGVQAGFSYVDGGSGVELANIAIGVDALGQPRQDDSGLEVSLGGGFSVVEGNYQAVDFPLPAGVSSVVLGSFLKPKSSRQLLDGFYLSDVYPASYRSALEESAGVALTVKTTSGSKIYSSRVIYGPKWIERAKSIDKNSGVLGGWQEQQYQLPLLTDYVAEALLNTGGGVAIGSNLAVAIYGSNAWKAPVYRSLAEVIVSPPRVGSITLNTGPTVEIDYQDTDAENGLNRPFSYESGLITLGLSLPRSSSGAVIKTDYWTKVTVRLSYFADDGSGELTAIAVAASEYPGAFSQSHWIGEEGEIKRFWKPKQAEFTYEANEAAIIVREQIDLTVDGEALLFSNKAIARVKMEVHLSTQGDETLTWVWLKR